MFLEPTILRLQLQQALDSLLKNRLRSLLSVLGIVCGVAALLAMVAIGQGAKLETLAQLEQLGLKNIIIRSVAFSADQLRAAREQGSLGLHANDVGRIHYVVKNIEQVAELRELKATTVALNRVLMPQLWGVSANYMQVQGLRLQGGRFFYSDEVQSKGLVCVLGAESSTMLADGGRVGSILRIDDTLCTVVGVLQPFSKLDTKGTKVPLRNFDKAILLPITTSEMFIGAQSTYRDELILQMQSSTDVFFALPLLQRVLQVAHRGVEDYRIIVPQELLRQAEETQKNMNFVLGSIAIISFLVGGTGVMNAMLANIVERTREIGVRRALGATQKAIRNQFLLESVLLTSMGGVLGLLLGLLITLLVSFMAGWPVSVSFWMLFLSSCLAAIVGLFFGLFPAVHAARLDPIVALRLD